MARRIFLLGMAGLMMLAILQVSLAVPSSEAVRLRNAFLLEPGTAADFGWTPATRPADFRWETASPDPAFVERARGALAGERRAFEGALLLAADLLRNAQDRGPIQSGLDDTYRRITTEGYGYCADFTDAFLALALAANIPARQWAFSFDGFGGHGHAFIEVFDSARGKWLMIDPYNNFYPVTTRSGEPMSALEFREILLDAAAPVRLQRISGARLGFPVAGKAAEYYRHGVGEWYLWWGNDVYTYDRQPLVRTASHLGRAAEQLVAVLTDAYPHFRVLDASGRAGDVARMVHLRGVLRFNLGLALLLIAVVVAAGGTWLVQARRYRQ
jgi:hypothetical protein